MYTHTHTHPSCAYASGLDQWDGISIGTTAATYLHAAMASLCPTATLALNYGIAVALPTSCLDHRTFAYISRA